MSRTHVFPVAALIIFLNSAASPGQPAAPEFDAASIRPGRLAQAGGEGSRREKIEHSPMSLTMHNVSLASSLQWAYKMQEYQIAGPDWRFSERYDILAKTARPCSADELRQMLQRLLTDRFRLTLHREMREVPVYVLSAGKKGSKLRKSQDDSESAMRIEEGAFVFEHVSMPEFAADLSTLRALDGRAVIDQTGIRGVFDIRLKLADDTAEMRRAMIAGDGLSIFTALQEQTGLKLSAEKGPVETLVIDHAQKVPSEN